MISKGAWLPSAAMQIRQQVEQPPVDRPLLAIHEIAQDVVELAQRARVHSGPFCQ